MLVMMVLALDFTESTDVLTFVKLELIFARLVFKDPNRVTKVFVPEKNEVSSRVMLPFSRSSITNPTPHYIVWMLSDSLEAFVSPGILAATTKARHTRRKIAGHNSSQEVYRTF